jgi:MerR family transcriptional regulator, heat shock protein HspR
MDDRPRYMISVAAELVGMHPQTLRIYETKGLVRPQRTAGNTRLYSDVDVERLRAIQKLTTQLGLNLAGVETVLRLEDEMRQLRTRLERLEREMRDEIRNVHKQYRREIVLYRDPDETLPERKRPWTSRSSR